MTAYPEHAASHGFCESRQKMCTVPGNTFMHSRPSHVVSKLKFLFGLEPELGATTLTLISRNTPGHRHSSHSQSIHMRPDILRVGQKVLALVRAEAVIRSRRPPPAGVSVSFGQRCLLATDAARSPHSQADSHRIVIEAKLIVVLPKAEDVVELVDDLRLVLCRTRTEILVRQRRPDRRSAQSGNLTMTNGGTKGALRRRLTRRCQTASTRSRRTRRGLRSAVGGSGRWQLRRWKCAPRRSGCLRTPRGAHSR